MMTQPPRSSCPASPSTSTLIFRIFLIDQVKPRIQRLIIFQRLGSLSTLMHKCETINTPKKKSPREKIATSLIHRMIYLASERRFQRMREEYDENRMIRLVSKSRKTAYCTLVQYPLGPR